jgi:hypothetical protein
MRNNVITAAVAVTLQLAYMASGQFISIQDPWPMLCVLSIVLVASVGGLLHRESQIMVGSLD